MSVPEDTVAFRRAMWLQAGPYIRYAFLAGALLFVAFWAWDVSIDADGARRTLSVRLAALTFYMALFGLLTVGRQTGAWIMLAYVAGILMAPVFLVYIDLLLADGHLHGAGATLLVILVVGMIGPYARFAIPLAVLVAIAPNALVFGLIMEHVRYPGLPDMHIAADIATQEAGAVVLVAVLALIDTRRRRLLFDAQAVLEQSATTDPLTGAMNRRGLDQAFAREAARQRRQRQSTALLMCDIDRFKQINDSHGHLVGDEVLRILTRRLLGSLRAIDTLARVGGEEFVAILPDTDKAGAVAAAERLRASVASAPFVTSAGEIAVRISIGATVVVAEEHNLEPALAAADEALYDAKNGGRDRWSFAPSQAT